MGNKQSSNQYISNNISFTSTSETLVRNVTNVTGFITVENNVNVEIEAETIEVGEDFVVTNGTVATLNLINQQISSITDSQVSEIQQGVENDANSLLEKTQQDFGALLAAASAGSEANKTIKNDISTTIKSTLTKETIINIVANSVVKQGTTVKIKTKALYVKGNFKIDSNVVVTLTAQNMVQETVDKILETKSVTDLINKLKDVQKQKTTGIASIIDSAGKLIKGVITSSQSIFFIIGAVIIVGIIFGAKAISAKRKAGGGAPKRIGQNSAQNRGRLVGQSQSRAPNSAPPSARQQYPSYPPARQPIPQQRRLPPPRQNGQQTPQQYQQQNQQQYQPQPRSQPQSQFQQFQSQGQQMGQQIGQQMVQQMPTQMSYDPSSDFDAVQDMQQDMRQMYEQ